MSSKSGGFGIGGLIVGGLVLAGAYLVNSMRDKSRSREHGGGGDEPRRYAVMFSVNEGPFRYMGANPDEPKKPYLTRRQAISIAESFVKSSQPVKGAARVVDVQTGAIIPF